MRSFEQLQVPAPLVNPHAIEVVAESESDLTYIARMVKERVIRLHRVQKNNGRYRWTFSVDISAKHEVLNQLRSMRAAIYEVASNDGAFAALYVPDVLFLSPLFTISRNL